MKTRIILAIVVSLLLITSSLFVRLNTSNTGPVEELSLESSANKTQQNNLKNSFTKKSSSSTSETLNNTDIISRGLIADYLDLSLSGRETQEGISNIADKYIGSITSIQSGIHKPLDESQLIIVANNSNSFEKYQSLVRAIHGKYGSIIKTTYPGNTILNTYSKEIYDYFESMSSAYVNMANELLLVAVPEALSTTHMTLVNNYYLTGRAMEALADTKTDSTTALAMIGVISESVEKQNFIINEINQILIKNTI